MSSPLHKNVAQIGQTLLADLTDIERLLAHTPDSEAAYEQLAAAMDHCLAQLRDLNVWGPENRLPSSELWNIAGHQLTRGWLQNQARNKPRGYAGDYEMLARIYENVLCDDPLGRLFDRYFQAQAAPQVVRNRMHMMAEWMVKDARQPGPALHVAVIGSAFGLDMKDALLKLDPADRAKTCVTLLDLDPAAIEYARQQLTPLLARDQLNAQSANLFRLAERPQAMERIAPINLLFCPGLFDYFDDPTATAMLRTLFARLAPGGHLTVFQFAPHNPSRSYMEWLGNWYLTYRDTNQFRALIEGAGIAAERMEFGAEPLGICLYATLGKPEDHK